MATMNLKALAEQRAALLAEMEAISETAKAETRAYSEEELARAEELEAQIRAIDATYKAEEARAVLAASPKAVPVDGEVVPTDKTEAEERAFAQYIVDSKAEFRSGELTMSANGAVIPASIVNKIISKVKEISPLYAMATKYNIGGTITIPYYDESTSAITMGYVEEFTELESHVGQFKSIELKGYLAGTLSLLSVSLINNSQFDVLGYIVDKMAEAIANWVEKELLHGTSEKITGLSNISAAMTVTAASQNASLMVCAAVSQVVEDAVNRPELAVPYYPDKQEEIPFELFTGGEKLVAEYANMSVPEVFELDIYDFRMLLRDAVIYNKMQTDKDE